MRNRTTPSTWRRRSRAALVGLTSLTLVLSGTASLATDGDDGTELLEELATEPTLESADDAGEATEDATEEPAAEPTDVPAPEEEPAAEPQAPVEVVEEPAAPAVEEAESTEEIARLFSGPAPRASEVVPLDVPPGDPAPGEAKIIVRAGGDRTGTGPESSSATPLAGVTFEILRFTVEPDPDETPTGVPVGTCTTDATGECGIFVDLPGQFDGNDAFFARMTGAPAGWVAPAQWGAAPGQEFTFWSDAVSADDPVADRIIELPLAFNETVTEPTAAAVRPNNVAPAQCGLDMAMVLDLSNSVTETEELLDEHKAAANDFIDAITGTPSQVALYTFGSEAPAAGPTNGGMPLTSVATPDGAQQIKNRINGYQATPTGGGGTNWDRAFHQVVESGVTYDVVLFLTDGQPTFHRDRQGPGDISTIAEVNEAILSANAVKATGAQVVLVGFGPEAFLPGASIRIPLVSGPDEGQDFYRTELENLSATLEEIASADCAGTLTVVKEVVDADGDVVPGGAGWTFGTTTEGVTPTTATTDDSSAVNFAVDYTPPVQTRSVTVTETQQAGYELVPVGGANARCITTGTGEVVPVTDSGDLGFTVDVAAADSVSCTVRNALVPPDYEDLVVSKSTVPSFARDWDWDITKVAEEDRLEVPAGEDGTFTYDVTVTPVGPVDSGFTVSGTITVENPNDVAFTGVDVTDSLPDSTCTVPGGTDVTVPAGDSLTLSYSCALVGATPTTTGINTATATWDAAAFPGTDGSATASAPFDFAAAAVTETDRYVTVNDSELDLSDLPGGNALDATDGVAVLTYDLEWPSTPGQCVEFENTATIVNSPESLSAPLVVNESSTEVVTLCAGLDLDVEKNVVLSFDRTYLWEIDKEADETTLTVDPDTGTATFDYTVTATPTGSTDAGWAMQGAITVTNPNDWLDITADVTDTVDVGGGAVCTVADGTGVLVAAGETVELTYTCTFITQPAYSGTNTATATWAETVPTPNSSATGTAAIAADDWAQTPINDVIDVVDDQTDPANPVPLGTATWNAEGTPTVFTYSLEHEGVPGDCVDFTNTAWIVQTEQSAEETVTVCAEVELTVAKTAVSADGRPDGDWEVVYEVVVTNESVLPGVYDLTDTLEFGEGITPLTAEWELEGTGEVGEWTGLPDEVTAVLADDRELAGESSHTYVVTVVADVAAGVVGSEEGRCTGDEGTDGGGFLNAATLTAYGEETTDRDCLPPTHERLEKVFDEAVELDDGTWEVSYTLVVDNSHSPSDKYYRLDDAPLFAEGVTILGRQAWDVTDPEDPQDLGWDGEGPILEQAFIEAGEVQRYAVTFVVGVGADVPDENLVCGPEGPGRGFFNRAVLTTGNDTIVDEDCGPIGEPAWTLTKSSDPVSGSTVDPGDTITYTVTATSTGDVALTDLTITDDLSDVVEHARPTGAVEASVGTVDWDGENLVWDIPTLTGTATLTYRVVVDDDAWNVRLRNVVTGEGPPPPVCIECTTTHITPPRRPGLPTTGAAVGGAALLAVLLSAGGITLATARRREED
ncbi:hypothetical protein AA0Y32_12295 [Georgenia phoenicis]|uniref:DUF7927 domain-containing protein n=1 Tax=unclassified Georgenia TaxID=2626815 RepID=UPI0039AFFC88